MRDTVGRLSSMTRQTSCSVCGARLTQAPRGRARRYCSDACRVRSQRLKGTADLPSDQFVPVTLKPAPVVHIHRGDEDQVSRAIVEARAVAFTLTRLSAEVHPALAWRCQKLGDLILVALAETFGKDTTE